MGRVGIGDALGYLNWDKKHQSEVNHLSHVYKESVLKHIKEEGIMSPASVSASPGKCFLQPSASGQVDLLEPELSFAKWILTQRNEHKIKFFSSSQISKRFFSRSFHLCAHHGEMCGVTDVFITCRQTSWASEDKPYSLHLPPQLCTFRRLQDPGNATLQRSPALENLHNSAIHKELVGKGHSVESNCLSCVYYARH